MTGLADGCDMGLKERNTPDNTEYLRDGNHHGTDLRGKGNMEPSSPWELHLNKPKKKDKCLISVNLSLARSVTGNFPNMCWPVYHHCSLYKKTSFIRISFRGTRSHEHAYREATKLNLMIYLNSHQKIKKKDKESSLS